MELLLALLTAIGVTVSMAFIALVIYYLIALSWMCANCKHIKSRCTCGWYTRKVKNVKPTGGRL